MLRKEKVDEFYKQIKEMKEIAKNDKNHYYVCLMGFEDTVVSFYENNPYYEDEDDREDKHYIPSNAVVYTKCKTVYKAPISLKDQMIDYIKDSYRAEYFTYSSYKSLLAKDYETFNKYIENKKHD